MTEIRLPRLPKAPQPQRPASTLELIRRAGAAGYPRRDLQKFRSEYRRMTPEQRHALLCDLVERGLVVVIDSPTGRGERFVAVQP